jgi:hypothetical protein
MSCDVYPPPPQMVYALLKTLAVGAVSNFFDYAVGSDVIVVSYEPAACSMVGSPSLPDATRSRSRNLDRQFIAVPGGLQTVTVYLRCAGRGVGCVARCGRPMPKCHVMARRYTSKSQRAGDRGRCGACSTDVASDPDHFRRCLCTASAPVTEVHFRCPQRYKLIFRSPIRDGTAGGGATSSSGPLTVVDVLEGVSSSGGVPFHRHTAPQRAGCVRRLAVDVERAMVAARMGAGNATPLVRMLSDSALS